MTVTALHDGYCPAMTVTVLAMTASADGKRRSFPLSFFLFATRLVIKKR
jgi:hypothetical protein